MIILRTLRRRDRFIILAIVGLVVAAVSHNITVDRLLPEMPPMLYYNSTGSLPKGLYIRIPFDSDLTNSLMVGDYVVYEPDEASQALIRERNYLPEGIKLLKKVGAVAGEEFYINGDTYQCYVGVGETKRYIGQVATVDHAGRFMPEVRGKHTVPEGHFFPVGNTAYSFDGRYTGPVPVKNILARVTPVFIEFW